ncbi:MAG: ATPase [Oscillospiraceae bacterium]|nr:ATPase [Oscillospiraceae bacterium]
MSIEKLELVSIAGAADELNEAIVACLKSGVFHIENAAKLLGSTEDSGSRSELNPYAEPLKSLAELDLRQIKIDADAEPLPAEFTPDQICKESARIAERLRSVREELGKTRKLIADYESASIHLKNLQRADIDLGELVKCKHIAYRFGRMPEENLQKLAFYTDDGFIFQDYHTEHEYVWGFYFAAADRILSVDAIMKGLLFERYELPDDLSGTPEQALGNMQIRLTEQKARRETLEKEQKQIYETESDLLGRMYRFAKYENEVWKLRSQCIVSQDKFNLMGYVPAKDKEAFKKQIDKVPDLSVTYEAPWADSRMKPPVRLKNNWFSKPFGLFVEMYGLPDYNGYNPTTLLAVTYTLLFGMMFGDLGQGIILALIGVFLDKKKHFSLGPIIARIGVSSAIFGALYGSVFGFEEWLDPVYESMGISFLPLKAMENSNMIIFGAIGIGVTIIIMSMLVNIIMRLKQRNFEEAIFGNNGLAGLLFFSSLVMMILSLIGYSILPDAALKAILAITLLLMFFREPLGHWMAHKPYKMPAVGEFIAANLLECFEFLIGYISNTSSFIRVGGFVFSHIGLMGVVMMLADNGESKSIIAVVIGNLVVMGFEGLIVGIQALRLEFYEIFSRCYDGGGRAFTPISVKFDDFSEQAQPEQAV